MPIKGMSPKQVMGTEMHKFKEGDLHSGSKKGPVVKSRAQAIAIGMSEAGKARKRPGMGGPDPLENSGMIEPERSRLATEIGLGRGVAGPGKAIGRSVAAPDVALPHRVAGSHMDNWLRHQPEIAHGVNQAPRKEGPAPGVLMMEDAHGYGHRDREGHLRNSGDPRAHRIGRR